MQENLHSWTRTETGGANNRRKTKRENPQIVEICDEMLSEPNATAPKVRRELALRGFTVSDSTIYRIGADLLYHWTKPWYTDILTEAQKYKRWLFCDRHLQLTEEQLLNQISTYLWTDEKWWDIVGSSNSAYVKATTKFDAKLKCKVKFVCIVFFFICHN